MAYQALYRKWRPSTFSDIVGQEHITATLQNEIKSKKIAQAYLFCGSRGTGKTTTARVFSKAVNCLHPKDGNPCNECSVCHGISNGSLMDIVEIDAASNNGVDNIRTINSEVSYLPSGVTYKIYIIDEVHMLSGSAFNALLKTLEEPPSHVIFILATTESHKIPATILSRCQRFDFKRISQAPMLGRLKTVAQKDNIKITDAALSLIIKAADGSMRDALSLLDQCSSGNPGEIDADWVRIMTGEPQNAQLLALGNAILEYDTEQAFLQVKQSIDRGFDSVRLLEGLLEYFRNLIVYKSSDTPEQFIELSPEELTVLSRQADKVPISRCLTALELLAQAYDTTRWAKNPKLILEMALIQLSHPKAEPNHLLKRVELLEQQMAQLKKQESEPSAPFSEAAAKLKSTRNSENDLIPVPEKESNAAFDEPALDPAKINQEPAVTYRQAKPEVLTSPSAVSKKIASPTQDKKIDYANLIANHWPELLDELERKGNPLLSGALRSGEFRVKDQELYLLDLLPMMDTPQNKALLEQAVKDICGVKMNVTFVAFGQSVPDSPPASKQEPDQLQQLAQHLSSKIKIIP